MYYITIENFIKSLQELPKDLEINSIGAGYHGDRHFISINDTHGNVLKEIDLNRRDNSAC